MIESAKIGAALAAAKESKTFSSAVALNPSPVPCQDYSAERRTPTSIIAICSFLSAVGGLLAELSPAVRRMPVGSGDARACRKRAVSLKPPHFRLRPSGWLHGANRDGGWSRNNERREPYLVGYLCHPDGRLLWHSNNPTKFPERRPHGQRTALVLEPTRSGKTIDLVVTRSCGILRCRWLWIVEDSSP